uniref:Uncharacterized protein n=1 Tax=viral metagenome TaxID=1070528 RepID=A0A6C0JAI4_9ZZZZ
MSDIKYLHCLHAYNYRMTNVQAALLYEQLIDIEHILENKYKIFDNYDKLFEDLISPGKVTIYKKEKDTVNSPWIYAVRILNNKTIEETNHYFKANDIDIRPFFYPINAHKHLETIENKDEVSYIFNREIIMIPSSPTITAKEQQKVADVIYKFILYIQDIEIIDVNHLNRTSIYNNFLSKITNCHFRYFRNRTIECLDNHITTLALYDKKIVYILDIRILIMLINIG